MNYLSVNVRQRLARSETAKSNPSSIAVGEEGYGAGATALVSAVVVLRNARRLQLADSRALSLPEMPAGLLDAVEVS